MRGHGGVRPREPPPQAGHHPRLAGKGAPRGHGGRRRERRAGSETGRLQRGHGGAAATAAGQTAQLVLLDAQFSAMPHIVREGRRRHCQYFALGLAVSGKKTSFRFFLSAILLVWAMPYPLLPGQISLISGVLIGLPSFLLTFERSDVRANGHFLRGALLNALPGGLCGTLFLLGTSVLGRALGLPQGQISSVCTLLAGGNRPVRGFLFVLAAYKAARCCDGADSGLFLRCHGLFFRGCSGIETLSARAWAPHLRAWGRGTLDDELPCVCGKFC